MIDFRYLLTTIVAVFLALAIGLLIGSGILADPLAANLDQQVQDKIQENNELNDEIDRLDERIGAEDDFGLQIEPMLTNGELAGDEIVLFVFDGTDSRLIDRVREAIQVADGAIVTTVTLTDRMSMSDPSAVEALLQDVPPGTTDDDEEDLASEVARALGSRAAADSAGATDETLFNGIQGPLEEHGFINVDREGETAIPPNAEFVVAGGAEGPAPYDIDPIAQALITGLSSGNSKLVATEGWSSGWGFVTDIRDSDVRDEVATIDHGDTVAGSISLVYELDRIVGNEPGHYGFRDGSDGIAPESLAGG